MVDHEGSFGFIYVTGGRAAYNRPSKARFLPRLSICSILFWLTSSNGTQGQSVGLEDGTMTNGLPMRLAKDPILEAVCELRFATRDTPASAILPGVMSSHFSSEVPRFEALPISSIPAVVRQADNNLLFSPLHRLVGDRYAISIGDRAISISTSARKYSGWQEFRPFVLSVFEKAIGTGMLGAIERLSIKYVNLLQSIDGANDIGSATNLVVKLGDHSLLDEPLQVRGEIRNGNLVTVVQIVSRATVNILTEKEPLSGMIIDVDTIWQGVEIKQSQIAEVLNAAHDEEKRVFFSLLTEGALKSMEPQYD